MNLQTRGGGYQKSEIFADVLNGSPLGNHRIVVAHASFQPLAGFHTDPFSKRFVFYSIVMAFDISNAKVKANYGPWLIHLADG